MPPLERLNHLRTEGSGRRRPGAQAEGLRHLALGGAHGSMLPPVVGWKTLRTVVALGSSAFYCHSFRNAF